jgi:hypothetical protein
MALMEPWGFTGFRLELLTFILVSYGMTLILVYGKIFKRIRPRHHFFHCPMCMGFWTGVFLFLVNPATELFSFDYNPINLLLLGCLSSGTSYILSMLFDDYGLKLFSQRGDKDV